MASVWLQSGYDAAPKGLLTTAAPPCMPSLGLGVSGGDPKSIGKIIEIGIF